MKTLTVTDEMYGRICARFALRIKELRLARSLQQWEFGVLCECKQASVSRWETGFCIPRVKKVCLISMRFAVSIDWLLGFSEEKQIVPHVREARA